MFEAVIEPLLTRGLGLGYIELGCFIQYYPDNGYISPQREIPNLRAPFFHIMPNDFNQCYREPQKGLP